MRRSAFLALGSAALAVGAIGCAPAPGPGHTPPTTANPPGGGPAAEVVTLTNARRADAGCGPLEARSQLTRAAQLHAEDMAANDYFSHVSEDGRTLGDRARAQGYAGRSLGENIARGYRSAEATVDGWMGSSGHRANIENCGYEHIGVGYDAGTRTWVQVFGG